MAHAAAAMPPLSSTVRVHRSPSGVVDVHAAALAAIAGDHFVLAVAVQVAVHDGVAVHQRIVDHLPLPRPSRCR